MYTTNNKSLFHLKYKCKNTIRGKLNIQLTYNSWAAVRALAASDVPIWNTTLSFSWSQVLNTTASDPFSTKSMDPRSSDQEDNGLFKIQNQTAVTEKPQAYNWLGIAKISAKFLGTWYQTTIK